ncbi:MAG TPA: FliH/SctL family protein [Pyrinomonadaceae bacterium]
MSARLLKCDSPLDIQPFPAFALPEDDMEFADGQVLSGISNADPESHAARIIEDAYAKAAQIEAEAREQIQVAVRAEVDAEIARVINPWREELMKSLEEVTALKSTVVQQTESELVRLALEIARKVIHLEVRSNAEVAVELTRAALSRVPYRAPATIHLNPEDFAYVQTNQHQLPSGHSLAFVEDRAIERGGCVVQTEMGEIDASIEQQFGEIEAALSAN